MRTFLQISILVFSPLRLLVAEPLATPPAPTPPLATVPAQPAKPQPPPPPLSFAEPVARVAPAVVTVVQVEWLKDEELKQFDSLEASDRKALVQQGDMLVLGERAGSPVSHGSGFIIDAKGHLVTNHHVIERDADSSRDFLVAVGNEGTWQQAHLIGADSATDLAVLKIDQPNPPTAEWDDSSLLRVGDIVLAIGTPQDLALRQTVTMGVVSAVGRSERDLLYEDFIQTDASINGGNSGGPLISLRGRVAGVNQSIRLSMVTGAGGRAVTDPQGRGILRASGNIGLGFAISSNLARKVVAELIQHGRVRRGFLGVRTSITTAPLPGVTSGLSLPGLKIETVLPGSPAEAAGLKPADVILTVNGAPVGTVEHFHLSISLTEPGTPAALELFRDGARLKVSPVLADLATTRYARIGFKPDSLEVPTIEGVIFRLIESPDGRRTAMAIAAVNPKSAAARAGLTAPALVVRVAGIEVTNEENFATVAATSVAGGYLLLTIRDRRGERNVSVPVSPQASPAGTK